MDTNKIKNDVERIVEENSNAFKDKESAKNFTMELLKLIKEEPVSQDEFQYKDEELERIVSERLDQLKAPENVVGYNCMITAIIMVFKNKRYLRAMTLELYPKIAEEFSIESRNVERCLRYIVEKVYANKTEAFLAEYGDTKPSNSKFIAREAKRLKYKFM